MFLSTNPSNENYFEFGVFSKVKREGWYNVIKKSEEPKLGDAPVGHPSIFQEDSSV